MTPSPPTPTVRVLVPDAHTRSALAVTRSLGRAGYEVLVASHKPRPLAGASRYARGEERLPDPLREPEAFATAVRALVRRTGVRVVFPTTEEAILALLPVRDELDAVLPLPTTDRFVTVNDKAALLERATALGIAVPRQHVVVGADDPLPSDLPYPLVAKPSRSVPLGGASREKVAARQVPDAASLRDLLREVPAAAYPLLLQQRIEGDGIGVFFLVWDGRVIARFAHRRLREKPPSGGVSVLSESVVAPDALERDALALLDPGAWQGVAMVEFKQDVRTGRPYLMEINARVWGSLQLAIDAGVDFPRLLVECALGHAPQPVVVGRPGHRLRWWFGDLDHLLIRLRRDRGGRGGAIRRFLTGGRGARNEVVRLDDWRPALRELREWVEQL